MHEGDSGIFFRYVDRRIHVAETGSEDDFGALFDQLGDHALGVGAFRHRFDKHGLNARHFAFQVFACLIMCIGPAGIADRPDIDKRHFQFFRRFRGLFLRFFLLAAATGKHQCQRHDHRHENQKFPVFHGLSIILLHYVSSKEFLGPPT